MKKKNVKWTKSRMDKKQKRQYVEMIYRKNVEKH